MRRDVKTILIKRSIFQSETNLNMKACLEFFMHEMAKCQCFLFSLNSMHQVEQCEKATSQLSNAESDEKI